MIKWKNEAHTKNGTDWKTWRNPIRMKIMASSLPLKIYLVRTIYVPYFACCFLIALITIPKYVLISSLNRRYWNCFAVQSAALYKLECMRRQNKNWNEQKRKGRLCEVFALCSHTAAQKINRKRNPSRMNEKERHEINVNKRFIAYIYTYISLKCRLWVRVMHC